jgi:hypothetical protein
MSLADHGHFKILNRQYGWMKVQSSVSGCRESDSRNQDLTTFGSIITNNYLVRDSDLDNQFGHI